MTFSDASFIEGRIVNRTEAKCLLNHRSDSIQGTDYIATPFQGFLGQKMKI